MAGSRTFEQAPVSQDGPEFTIAGHDGSWTESFRCWSAPPASVAWSVNQAIWFDVHGARHTNTASCIVFLLACLVDNDPEEQQGEGDDEPVVLLSDRSRFASLIDDPKRMVTSDTIGAVAMFLMEEYGLRPTGAS